MKIAKETWIILAIGVADLITTIVFIRHHGAEEANPLFRSYWQMGLVAFVAAKAALLVGPLGVLEWARRRRPKFVSWALRCAIVGYLVMYIAGCVRMNYHTVPNYGPAPVIITSLKLPHRIIVHAHRGTPRRTPKRLAAHEESASGSVIAY